VAIAAIVAVFWPISGYFTDLQTQADARKAAFSTARSLLLKPRTLPVLDPQSTDPQPLPVFPTDAVFHRGSIATDALKKESQDMLTLATGMIVHQPLVPGALPAGGTVVATQFQNQYKQLMTYPAADPTATPPPLPISILHAGVPPLDADIKAKQDQIKTDLTNRLTERGPDGNPINGPDVEAKVEDAVMALPAQERTKVATENQMYIAPDAYRINPALTGINPPSTVSMFNGQIGLWLLQDVFTALASANADTTGGVPGSRVKHLIKIDFADAPFTPNFTPTATPAPAPADPHALQLNMSPTGHVSNTLYDVIPFSLKIIVDAQQVPAVLEALSKDRFITVLRMDLLTVDSGAAVLAGYLYGDKPVVQLNLSCEELFFRQQDTLPIMPDSIKTALGIVPAPAAQ
jgi:hypothetical protein